MWCRVVNLPFNLRDEKWSKAIADQIDKKASSVQVDHAVVYLRVRVTMEVEKPLRRWIWIESLRRECMDPYDFQYEKRSSFLFLVSSFGPHGSILSEAGNQGRELRFTFWERLRAPDESRRSTSSESSSWEQHGQGSKVETCNLSTVADGGTEVTCPAK